MLHLSKSIFIAMPPPPLHSTPLPLILFIRIIIQPLLIYFFLLVLSGEEYAPPEKTKPRSNHLALTSLARDCI